MEAKKNNVKLYLSGPVSNNPDARNLFYKAEEYYSSIGYEVVNPLKLNMDCPTWEQAMRRDIAALMDCDAIVMLPGWELSKGAKLEHFVAYKLGLDIRYSEYIEYDLVENILRACYIVTGITIKEMRSKSRQRHIVDARRIISHLIRRITKYPYEYIGSLLTRDHSTIIWHIKSCEALLNTDKQFANLYKVISQSVTGTASIDGTVRLIDVSAGV